MRVMRAQWTTQITLLAAAACIHVSITHSIHHLMGVRLMGVYLTGVCLMRVYLINISWAC